MFLRFAPQSSSGLTWVMQKLGQDMNPADVVVGGSKKMHSISEEVHAVDSRGSFYVRPCFTPLFVFGEPTAFPTPTDTTPDFKQGMRTCKTELKEEQRS
jgi:hypothetical protein